MANIYQNPAMRVTLARFIRSQMELNGMTYKTLCQEIDLRFAVKHNPDTLRNKVSTGALGSQMLFFMLLAMNTESVEMKNILCAYERARETSN